MSYVFISYSHKDKGYVKKLAQSLRQSGLEYWLDDRIDYGSRWPRVIQDQVDGCDAFIVVMTPRSLESEWVQNELSRAQRKKKPIFPLLLEGGTWLSVEATQLADVRDRNLPPKNFYDRLARVLSAVGRTDGRRVAEHAPRPAAAAPSETRWGLGSVVFFLGVVSTLAARALLEAVFVTDNFREAMANVWTIGVGAIFLVLTIGVTYWANQRWWLWGCTMLLLGIGVSYGALSAVPEELGLIYTVASVWLALTAFVTYRAWRGET